MVAPWVPSVLGGSSLTVFRILSSTEGAGGGLGTLSEWREVPGPARRRWAAGWPQGQGLCQVWAAGVEMAGGESAGAATPCFCFYLRSQQPYPRPHLSPQHPSHGGKLCECLRGASGPGGLGPKAAPDSGRGWAWLRCPAGKDKVGARVCYQGSGLWLPGGPNPSPRSHLPLWILPFSVDPSWLALPLLVWLWLSPLGLWAFSSHGFGRSGSRMLSAWGRPTCVSRPRPRFPRTPRR